MNSERLKETLNSRYVLRKTLGEFPPWHGYSVSDSLSDKEYLFFSLELPANTALSIDDLRMRDHLFARPGAVAPPALSLQQAGGIVSFLLPHEDLVPLTKALPLMRPQRALAVARTISAYVLDRFAGGCVFANLAPESVCMAADHPVVLPTAYLVPGDLLATIGFSDRQAAPGAPQPYRDFHALADLLAVCSRYLEKEISDRAQRAAGLLRGIDPSTPGREYVAAIEAVASFAETPVDGKRFFPARVVRSTPPAAPLRAAKQLAARSRDGERTLAVIRGSRGGGNTYFLECLERDLVDECGYRGGSIADDRRLFQDMSEKEVPDGADFALVDDHAADPFLSCHVMDFLCQSIERCAFTALAAGDDGAKDLVDRAREEAARRGVTVREIELPPPNRHERRRILAHLDHGRPADEAPAPAEDTPFALERLDRIAAILAPASAGAESGAAPLDALTGEERSVLAFLAAFSFEAPLAFILAAFAPEEKGVFAALCGLELRGLVRSRAETSALAGGAVAIVYRVAGRSIGAAVLETIPPERRVSIHRNVARLLAGRRGIPTVYSFLHLARGGEEAAAALAGHEIMQSLMRRRKIAPLACFNDRYLGEKLDRALPTDARYGLLLELGTHFTLAGSMDAAECFFRRCREDIAREREPLRFRSLAVEAARRESEILEKRGEFLKAERLLGKALETHGDELLAGERAKLYNDLAWIHYRLGAFDRSWESCLLVHRLLDEKQHPAEIAQSLNLMGTINWNRSKYDEAILCFKRSLALREECGDEIGVAATYNNLGLVYRSLGACAEALECFSKSMEIKRRTENLPGLAAAHLNQALVYLDMERFKDAERSCSTAAHLAGTIGNQQLLAEAHGTLGEIHFLQGNFEKAASFYRADLDLCDRTKSLRERAVVLRKLGELNLARGNAPEAIRLLEDARSLNQRIGSRLETALLGLLEGRILLADGRFNDGRYKLESAGLELSLLGRKNAAASVAAEIGSRYLAEGNEPLAREYLVRSLSLASGSEHVPAPVRTLGETLDRRSPLSRDRLASDADRFQALCRMTAALHAARSAPEIENVIADTALRVTGMERSAIVRPAEGKDAYRVAAGAGGFSGGSLLADRRVAAVISVARQLGYPLDATRTTLPENRVPAEFLEERPRIACMPLRLHGETAAFLYLDSTRGGPGTSDEDYALLVAFCQQASLALERIELAGRVEDLEKPIVEAKPVLARGRERVTFQDVIGSSPPMRHLYGLIEGIKGMDTTVLLTGSNGTGKDLTAKTIHYGGPRAEKPFVALNCAAIPAELLESELFGHERGSFSGAIKQRIGHFESANGGTIFLNEIGDLPLDLQPKLLHVLEDKVFYRVGGSQRISTNVRIIAATNKDLFSLVRQGQFREDLYYRINVFPIRIPDLNERVEDIEPLALHFLTTYCRLYGIPVKRISSEAMAHLIEYEWPGNVRELENTINRIIITTKKETILPEDLPEQIVKRPDEAGSAERASIEETIDELVANVEFSAADPILPRVEGMIVSKIVEKLGDKTKAAAVLGISKPTVYAKLKKYGARRAR